VATRSVRARLPVLTWVERSLLLGAVLSVAWSFLPLPRGSLALRAAGALVLFVALPMVIVYGVLKGLAVYFGDCPGTRFETVSVRRWCIVVVPWQHLDYKCF